jgi:transposase-like protein
MTKRSPFRYFKTSPEIIRLAVMLYVRFPLSLRNVEDLLHERGIEISHETVRFWWNRFGPMLAAEIRRKRVSRMRAYPELKQRALELRRRWRADILGRIADHKITRLDELMPWRYAQN